MKKNQEIFKPFVSDFSMLQYRLGDHFVLNSHDSGNKFEKAKSTTCEFEHVVPKEPKSRNEIYAPTPS